MRLFRFGHPGQEQPGAVLPDGKRIDCSGFGEDWNEQFFETDGLSRLASWLEQQGPTADEVPQGVRLGPPVGRPSKIVCIGLNYRDHAKETGAELPAEPVIFFKSTTAIVGPNDDVLIPPSSTKSDWEVELAVVVGNTLSYADQATATKGIAGYCLHNDLSEREFQLERCGQWVKGKSCNTFAPLGPELVTPDELPDPLHLDMWLTVNGEMLQKSNTRELFFDVPTILSSVSQYMTLLPGDVISTGTPAGVGLGLDPPRFLKAGDVMELSIEGLGTQRQTACSSD
ncbi:MAG: fumarylacetoacetate hydrolase family protein [Planctomycetota bacterium]|nr:ureidoglycolate lyase [Planctomycetota bacterium]MEE2883154.1 fumarylacetoacetate hydrolase family protein [Planctomycetota bacterium]